MSQLPRIWYLSFPFRMTDAGGAQSLRLEHIWEQVQQVIFTSPGERVFRPEFGFGARAFVFEPNASPAWELMQNRLYGSLAEALAGEIDPKTLRVEVRTNENAPERLDVHVSYLIASIQKEESHVLPL